MGTPLNLVEFGFICNQGLELSTILCDLLINKTNV
jgi:hypothetical protein